MPEYKTLSEWRRLYKEKESLMHEWGYPEVSPHDFYRDLFPEGSLQQKGVQHCGKGNIVGNNLMLTRSRKVIISDGLEDLPKLVGARFGLIGPFSSFGESYKQDNAHELFALAIDIDYVGKVHLKRLLRQFQNYEENKKNTWKRMPPSYLVSSGRGIHLYYFLDKPIELYKHRAKILSELKMALVNYMWNESTSMKAKEPDRSGIYQCFRCVGSLSKICLDKDRKKIVTREYPVRAYRITGKRYSLEEIRDSIEGCTIDLSGLYQMPEIPKGKVSKAEAAELWPDWYERRIEKGEPPRPHKKTWTCNTALYEWWKQKVRDEAIVGGRYYTIVALCCYGRKCGISDGKIRKDAWELYEFLESITDDEANHFTRQDMRDALGILKDPDMLHTIEHTRQWIEEKTKIEIPPNKRNPKPRNRKTKHQEYRRGIKALKIMMGEDDWNKGGRPTAEQMVRDWRIANPEGRKIDCQRETGLSRPTVLKWWDVAEPDRPRMHKIVPSQALSDAIIEGLKMSE